MDPDDGDQTDTVSWILDNEDHTYAVIQEPARRKQKYNSLYNENGSHQSGLQSNAQKTEDGHNSKITFFFFKFKERPKGYILQNIRHRFFKKPLHNILRICEKVIFCLFVRYRSP